MKAQWYAEALHRALRGKHESEIERIVARFGDVVRTRGHAGLLAHIAQEFDTVSRRAREHQKVFLVSADEKGRARGAFAYEHYQREDVISPEAISEEIVDKTIVGGYQLRGKNWVLDRSYKSSLVDLYNNISRKH